MAVELADLLPSLQASLNTPGDIEFFKFEDNDDAWEAALANAFWWAKIRKFFTGFRVNVDGDLIENVAGGDDMPREDQQIIVLFAAMLAIETKLLALVTSAKQDAGPVSTEYSRSSTLLKTLLNEKRAELEAIKEEVLNGRGSALSVQLVDAVLARESAYGLVGDGYPFVR